MRDNLDEAGQPAAAMGLGLIDVDATSDAIFWIAPDGHFLDVNAAACRSLGYTRDALLKLSIPDVDAEFSAEQWQAHLIELRQQMGYQAIHGNVRLVKKLFLP